MEELTLTDRGTHFNVCVCVCVHAREGGGRAKGERERDNEWEREWERVVNTAARRGRTSVREINLQLSKLVLEHCPKKKRKKEGEKKPHLNVFWYWHLEKKSLDVWWHSLFLMCSSSLFVPQGSSVYHFLGCQVITQEDSVCACECGCAAGQRDSKASLFERTRRKRWPAQGDTMCPSLQRWLLCCRKLTGWQRLVTFRSRERWISSNREVFARKVQHTRKQTTLNDYLKLICVFNISCSCGNITASLCKHSIEQEEL